MPHHFAALCLILASGSAPQPEPPSVTPSATARQIPSIPDALASLHKTYRDAPLADRVVMRVVAADTKERRVQIIVYTDRGVPDPAADASPAAAAIKPRPAQFRADLGQLHIHIKDRSLTALNLFDRTTYFRTVCGDAMDAALTRNFPPIPLPQVQLCFAADTALATPTPLTPGVTWTSIEAGTDVGRALIVLKGSSSAGPVTLSYDRTTGRVRRFVAEFPAATGAALAKLELTCSPADAGDSKNWLLPVDGRTRVDSPALLVPPRSGLAEGSSVKHASLMTHELAPLAPEALFAGPNPPETVVLVTIRFDAFRENAPPPDLAAAIGAAVRAAAETAGSGKVVPRVVALLGKNELDPEKIATVVQALSAACRSAGLESSPLVTASEVLSIERGGQPADIAVIALAPDLKVRGVAVADGRAEKASELAEEVAALTKVAPAEPPKNKPDGPKEPSGGK